MFKYFILKGWFNFIVTIPSTNVGCYNVQLQIRAYPVNRALHSFFKLKSLIFIYLIKHIIIKEKVQQIKINVGKESGLLLTKPKRPTTLYHSNFNQTKLKFSTFKEKIPYGSKYLSSHSVLFYSMAHKIEVISFTLGCVRRVYSLPLLHSTAQTALRLSCPR